jgi:hypothetical protein
MSKYRIVEDRQDSHSEFHIQQKILGVWITVPAGFSFDLEDAKRRIKNWESYKKVIHEI